MHSFPRGQTRTRPSRAVTALAPRPTSSHIEELAAPATKPVPPNSPFAALGLKAGLVQALADEGYDRPTPIQAQAIPHVLEGRDLVGCAQTGTGKTAAFVLPLLQRLGGRREAGRIRALVLTPTRELAAQIGERATAYGRHTGLRNAVIYGGVNPKRQEADLARRPELVVATPGRLLDLMQQGIVSLGAVEVLVLDEADNMLDMGFIHDVRRIVAKVPKARQTLLFSATMPKAIEELSKTILVDPVRVAVTPVATPAETVDQSVYFVPKADKRALLIRVLRTTEYERTLVFTRTKHGANRVAEQLTKAGIEAAAIHGNKSQNARERALDGFRRGAIRVLVATDIAARGIDVDGVSHVINFDLPEVAESYVHRIGRTGRAGATGAAIAFCDAEERPLLVQIERLIRRKVRIAEGGEAAVAAARREAPPSEAQAERRGPREGIDSRRRTDGGAPSGAGRRRPRGR